MWVAAKYLVCEGILNTFLPENVIGCFSIGGISGYCLVWLSL